MVAVHATRCPHNHNHSGLEPAGRDKARFAISEPIILDRRDGPGKNVFRIGEIEISVPKRGFPLCGIEVDRHQLNYVVT